MDSFTVAVCIGMQQDDQSISGVGKGSQVGMSGSLEYKVKLVAEWQWG